VVSDHVFAAGGVDTGYIAANYEALFAPDAPLSEGAAVVAALCDRGVARSSNPWHATDAWSMGTPSYAEFQYTYGADSHVTVRLRGTDEALQAQVIYNAPLGREGQADRATASSVLSKNYTFDRATNRLTSETSTENFQICAVGTVREIQRGAHRWRLQRVDPCAPPQSNDEGGGHLRAPMPGTIISVLVKVGDTVSAGQPLLVMEAMKMEHTIKAPSAGKVAQVHYQAGEQVKEGAELVEIS
jgi:3-methylcrotonyl-CoA carboxylase alpha subunit